MDYANGLGEKDVFSFTAEDIRRLMTPVVKEEPGITSGMMLLDVDGGSSISDNSKRKRKEVEVEDVTESMRKRQKEENTVVIP